MLTREQDIDFINYMVHHENLFFQYYRMAKNYQFVYNNARHIWEALSALTDSHKAIPKEREVVWYLKDSPQYDFSEIALQSLRMDLADVYNPQLTTEATGNRVLKWITERELYHLSQMLADSAGASDERSYEQVLKQVRDMTRQLARLEEMVMRESDEIILPFSQETIEDIENVMAEMRLDDACPTPYPLLNSITRGGQHAGEFSLMIALSGFGKTTFMIDWASMLAHTCRRRVVYYSLDDTKANLLDRAWRRLAQIPSDDIDIQEYKERIQFNLREYNNRMVLRVLPRRSISPDMLKYDLEKVRRFLRQEAIDHEEDPDEAEEIHLVIGDYLDEFLPPYDIESKEYRHKLDAIARGLGALAMTEDIPVAAPTQANREALKRDMIGLENTSESIGKIFPAKLIIALMCTDEEYSLGLGRIGVLKNTWGIKDVYFPVQISFAQQRIIQAPGAQLYPLVKKRVKSREEEDGGNKPAREEPDRITEERNIKWGGESGG